MRCGRIHQERISPVQETANLFFSLFKAGLLRNSVGHVQAGNSLLQHAP